MAKNGEAPIVVILLLSLYFSEKVQYVGNTD